ncbi:hypothetical protein BGX33_000615, partial [Mortierella sp. NVP41]
VRFEWDPAEPTTIEVSEDEEEYMDTGSEPTIPHPKVAGSGAAQEECSQIIETDNAIQPQFLLDVDDLLLDAYDSPDSEDDEDLERLVPESHARARCHRTCASNFHLDGDCEDDKGEDGSVYGDSEGQDQSDDLYHSSSDEWSSDEDEDEDDDDNDNMSPTIVLIQYSASSASGSTDVCQDEILEANIKRQSSTLQLGSAHGRRNSSLGDGYDPDCFVDEERTKAGSERCGQGSMEEASENGDGLDTRMDHLQLDPDAPDDQGPSKQ